MDTIRVLVFLCCTQVLSNCDGFQSLSHAHLFTLSLRSAAKVSYALVSNDNASSAIVFERDYSYCRVCFSHICVVDCFLRDVRMAFHWCFVDGCVPSLSIIIPACSLLTLSMLCRPMLCLTLVYIVLIVDVPELHQSVLF